MPLSRLRVLLAGELAGVVALALLHVPLDLEIYRRGGAAVRRDGALYADQLLGHWFTYPPFAAELFRPLALLPDGLVRVGWALASVAALASAARDCLLLAGKDPAGRVPSLVAAALPLEPVWHTLALGQVNLLLLAAVLADLRRAYEGRSAGIGVGLAAAVKLTPGVFVVLLLVTSRRRCAARAVTVAAGCTALGAVLAPTASLRYWSGLFHDTSRVGVAYIADQSPYGVAARLLGGPDQVPGAFVLLPLALGAVGLAVARAAALRGDSLRATAAAGVAGLLLSPVSWTHHWVWALPALLVLAAERPRAAATAYAVLLVSPPWWTPHDGGPREYGWHGLVTVAADAYLLLGVGLLALLAHPPASTPARPREDAGAAVR
ncbi:alpha-1,2-mannosyltransferase [Motilibacter rhizosphaerae]|uniref:Alpha-1,2-mannosyltransferase n=1 Tax=Motilibacter rhizosphaerae TaxID=598652 RepID=A0A4Q7NTB4_9ACTN|nr:glycosyltransferase 87 family protein [Motilibacter rhizosphaerae]RZS90357.1 alpha-1,2-mannosyltransferase [Motilibacter rhizosphaerae]